MQLAVAGLFVCGGLAASMRLWTGQSLLALAVVLAAVGAGLVGLLCMAARRTVLTCLPSLIWQAILTRCDARQPLVAWSALHLGTVLPRLPSLIWQAILAALLVADLWTMGYSLFVLRPAREVWAEGRDVAAYLAAQERPFRVYSPSYSLPQHTGAFFGLEQLDGVDPSQLRWTAHYMALAGRYQVAGYGVIIPFFPEGADVRTAWQGVTPDATLLGLLNGQFVVSAFPIATVQDPDWALRVHLPGGYIYENRRCLPRAFTVARAEAVAGWQEAQAGLAAGFDPAGGALVEGGTPLSGPPGCQEARVTHISPNRIVVEAEVSQAALLVLGEVWYPGWRVEVDGVAQPLYRVDGIVRGTYLEPGAHVVTWTYEPASVRWGAGLSLAAVCCLVGYGVVSFVQRRGSRGSG